MEHNTPFVITRNPVYVDRWTVKDERGEDVCDTEDIEYAEFIVRAVNNYQTFVDALTKGVMNDLEKHEYDRLKSVNDALVAALEILVEELDDECRWFNDLDAIQLSDPTKNQVRAALKLARGEES